MSVGREDDCGGVSKPCFEKERGESRFVEIEGTDLGRGNLLFVGLLRLGGDGGVIGRHVDF